MKAPNLMRHMPLERGREQYTHYVELFRVADKMQQFGTRFDMGRGKAHAADAEARRKRFCEIFISQSKLAPSAMGPSGSGQTDAVRRWFRDAGAPEVMHDKRTGKAQFNAPALTIWAKDYPGAPFSQPAAALLGLRKAATAARFVEAYLAVASRHNSRIHFGFNPMGTKGLRWSASAKFAWREGNALTCYSLNAQNVPSKDIAFDFENEGRLPIMVSLRDCFIPDTGCVFAKADYDQLEARLIAYVTGAKKLLQWMQEGRDIHIENARAIFEEAQIPHDATKTSHGGAWKRYREAAKPMVYALTYSVSTPGKPPYVRELYKNLKQAFPQFTEDYVKALATRFYKLHPEIIDFHARIRRDLESTGSVVLPQTGRRLYFAPTMRGFNQAANFYFQSGGGALINRAIIPIAEACRWERNATAVLLQVHDELSMQIEEREVDAFAALVESEMSRPMQFGPTFGGVTAAVDIGPNWKDVKARC